MAIKGKFITFEGPEGCGKSTQSKLLSEFLAKKGYQVLHLREPGSTEIGEKIRQILLDPKNKAMSNICELFLYMAARSQLVEEKIIPNLKKGKIIICDRFQDATLAYQGYAGGLDIKMIKCLGSLATFKIKPDLTILLDSCVKAGFKRINRALDRLESKSFKYHLKVRKGYLALAKQEPKRIKVILLEEKIDNTQNKIREIILKCLLHK